RPGSLGFLPPNISHIEVGNPQCCDYDSHVHNSNGIPLKENSHMRNRSTRWAIVITAVVTAVLVSLFFIQSAVPVAAQAQGQSVVRTGGHPDFSGIWEANNSANWDLLTHESRPLVGQQGLTAN